MKTEDHNAAYTLLADGSLIDFDVIESKITTDPDKSNVSVRLYLCLGGSLVRRCTAPRIF